MGRSKFADKGFWVDLVDRAVVSFAQGALVGLGLGEAGLSLFDMDVQTGLGIAGAYALASVLTTVVARGNSSEE